MPSGMGSVYTNNIIDYIDGSYYTYVRDNGVTNSAHRWYCIMGRVSGANSDPAKTRPSSSVRIDAYELWGVALWTVGPYNGGFCAITIDSVAHILDKNFRQIVEFSIEKPDNGLPPYQMSLSGGNAQLKIIENADYNTIYFTTSAPSYSIYSHALYKINVDTQKVEYIGYTESTPYVRNISWAGNEYIEGNKLYTIFTYSDFSAYAVFSLSGFSSSSVTVGSICREALLRAGLEENDFDVSEGTKLVNGYALGNPISTRAAITPLTSAYGYDLIEVDSLIRLKLRDPTDVKADIYDVIDFVEMERRQDVELSKSINIMYANKDKNYDAGIQSTMRNDISAKGTKTYQYPMALSDTKAKKISEVYLYSEWNERTKFKFSLPPEYIWLTPSDMVRINYENATYLVRLTKIDYVSDGQLNCEASLENSTMYESEAIGSDTGTEKDTVTVLSDTRIALLDIPMLDNAYDSEGIYMAVDGYSDQPNDWPGCSVFKSIDSEITYNVIGNAVKGTILGNARNVLGTGTVHTYDLSNSVIVATNKILYSVTWEDLLAGINYIVLGSEILQYKDAVDNGDGTYTLSHFLRGRRGTEWAVSSHVIGELFVLLSADMLFDNTASLNVNSHYKAVSLGAYIEDVTSKEIIPEIICLKPFSVSRMKATYALDSINVTWARRSRDVTGYFKSLQLFEDFETYNIDIYDINSIFLRSEQVSNISKYEYTQQKRIDDGLTGDSNDSCRFVVYQVSGTVGNGYGSEIIF